jgi:hypothetical protein
MLRCVDPVHPPDAPPWLYLRENSDGRREARHINADAEHHSSGESDEHKALKERIARAATDAGFQAEVEQRPAHRRRRTDVLVHGDGVKLGFEPQLSQITARTVRRRSKVASDDGITPAWMVDSLNSKAIDQAPWARVDRKIWHEYLSDTELPIRGGIRGLRIEQCARMGTVCPDRRVGRRCTGWHGSWSDPLQATRFDDLVVRAAARDLIPVRVQISFARVAWFWVTSTDLAKVEPSDTSPATMSAFGATIPMPRNPQPLEYYCNYSDGDSPHPRTPTIQRPGSATQPAGVRLINPAPPGHPGYARIQLNWSDPWHMTHDLRSCRFCGQHTYLRDDNGRPCHKVCAEARG